MSAILSSLVGPVTGLLDKFIEDKDQKNALAHEIATMSERHAQELAKGQLEVNKVEAASKSMFVAGWRPAWLGDDDGWMMTKADDSTDCWDPLKTPVPLSVI